MTAFIRGLTGSIRMFVIQRNPRHFNEAVMSARLAQESLTVPGPTNTILDRLSDQEKTLKDLTEEISTLKSAEHVPRINKNSEYRLSCQLCGKNGHSAKECRKFSVKPKFGSGHEMNKSDITWYNGQKTGHYARECKSENNSKGN